MRYVIHAHMSKSCEAYFQETGRAGRDGGVSRCILLYKRSDIAMLAQIVYGGSNTYDTSGAEDTPLGKLYAMVRITQSK